MPDVSDLLDSLKRSPNLLSAFVRTIPEDKLDLRRGKDFWTIAEHVSHLAQAQPMILERIQRFMQEDRPEFVPYIPGSGEEQPKTPPRMDIPAAIEQLTSYRNKQLSLLSHADGATLQKQASHPEYEHYSLYILARHILLHDYWHMYRMEELWLTRDSYLAKME